MVDRASVTRTVKSAFVHQPLQRLVTCTLELTHLPWPALHSFQLVSVPRQLAVQFLDLDLDPINPAVRRTNGILKRWFWLRRAGIAEQAIHCVLELPIIKLLRGQVGRD